MPLPRTSLRSFLSTAKSSLTSAIERSAPVTFVVGNESADLDSICSAVILAYFRTHAAAAATTASQSPTIYIPVSNLPRADLSLRPELIPVLNHANLRPSDLITLSDLPGADSDSPSSSSPRPGVRLQPANTKWILVDHNSLLGELGQKYAERVVGCIDHHDEENRVPQDTGDEPRIVQKCGSCTSLVVDYCRPVWDSLSQTNSSSPSGTSSNSNLDEKENSEALWNSQIALLAIAPILIDTTNLSVPSRTCPEDIAAVEYLQKWISAAPSSNNPQNAPPSTTESPEFSATAYFDSITAAKADLGDLSLPDILRKDYKEWTINVQKSQDNDTSTSNTSPSSSPARKLGISSAVKPISYLVTQPASSSEKQTTSDDAQEQSEAFTNAVQKFAEERDLAVFAIMTTHTDDEGKFCRELCVLAIDGEESSAVEKLVKKNARELKLEDLDGNRTLGRAGTTKWKWWCWKQGNTDLSRKQVAPMLRNAMAA